MIDKETAAQIEVTEEQTVAWLVDLANQGKNKDEILRALACLPKVKEFIALCGDDLAPLMTQRDFEVWLLYPNEFVKQLNALRGKTNGS